MKGKSGHDIYEHSYHMDYGAKAAGYVDAFNNNIHWERGSRSFCERGKSLAGRNSPPTLHLHQVRLVR